MPIFYFWVVTELVWSIARILESLSGQWFWNIFPNFWRAPTIYKANTGRDLRTANELLTNVDLSSSPIAGNLRMFFYGGNPGKIGGCWPSTSIEILLWCGITAFGDECIGINTVAEFTAASAFCFSGRLRFCVFIGKIFRSKQFYNAVSPGGSLHLQ